MKKILIVGPDTHKAKGGMAQVIEDVRHDEELNKQYTLNVFSSYRDGSRLFVIFYGILRFIAFFFTVPFYDLVHIHMTVKGSAKRKGIYTRIAKLFHKKVIIQIHRCENFTDYYKACDEKTRKSIRETLQKADMVLCLSASWMKDLERVVEINNCRYLPNGINIRDYDFDLDGNYVLFLGRIMPQKGVKELLEAKKILESKGIDFSLKIAGPIDDAIPYIQLSNKLGLTGVSFEGWVSGEKKRELLKNAAVMVLPSYNEGFPISVLEGIASGCAIVVTDIASVHDMIDEEIVPIKDAEALAAGLERMMTDSYRRKSALKNIGRLKANFTAEAVHRQLGKYYEEVLNS